MYIIKIYNTKFYTLKPSIYRIFMSKHANFGQYLTVFYEILLFSSKDRTLKEIKTSPFLGYLL